MDVAVVLDTTGDGQCAASTMVMVIPSLKVLRDGTAVPEDRSDGGLGSTQPRPITPTWRRDVPSFNVPPEGLGRRRLATSRGWMADPNLPALPKLFRTSNQAVDPREVSMKWDTLPANS